MLKILWVFLIQMDHVIQARRLDLDLISKKKRTFRLINFATLPSHRVKVKEGEQLDKCLSFDGDMKNWRNNKLTEIPIVVGTLGTVHKTLKKRLKELEI